MSSLLIACDRSWSPGEQHDQEEGGKSQEEERLQGADHGAGLADLGGGRGSCVEHLDI